MLKKKTKISFKIKNKLVKFVLQENIAIFMEKYPSKILDDILTVFREHKRHHISVYNFRRSFLPTKIGQNC